jgi:hypothetical protein
VQTIQQNHNSNLKFLVSTYRGGIKIFKALARLASNSKVFTRQIREKLAKIMSLLSILYRVHFVCTRPTRKVDCVCVIIINKSPYQMCVCISESGRNKTQLVEKRDSLRGGKNTCQAGE